MNSTPQLTIKVTSAIPEEQHRDGIFELLQYPTLEECRMHEGTEEPLIFIWRLGRGLTTRAPLRAEVVGGDGLQTFVHGRDCAIGYPGHKVVVTYDGEMPAEFRSLERIEPSP